MGNFPEKLFTMIISNKRHTVFLRRLFFLVSLAIALAALVLFLLNYNLFALIVAGLFAFWFLFFQVADYQFIEFSDDDHKVLLRYYKVVHFGKISFNSIEFPQRILYNARFDHSVFGKFSDLTLVVKTRRGIAEYPSVSLTALSETERKKIHGTLSRITGI
jgi:hypothetical protein